MWDGDIRKSRKRLTKVYSFFCSKPTAWDGDYSLTYRSRITTSAFVPSPLCGVMKGTF